MTSVSIYFFHLVYRHMWKLLTRPLVDRPPHPTTNSSVEVMSVALESHSSVPTVHASFALPKPERFVYDSVYTHTFKNQTAVLFMEQDYILKKWS